LQNVKKFPGVIPPDPRGGRGRPPPCALPQLGLRPRAGARSAPGSAVPKGRQLNVALGRQMCKAGPVKKSRNVKPLARHDTSDCRGPSGLLSDESISATAPPRGIGVSLPRRNPSTTAVQSVFGSKPNRWATSHILICPLLSESQTR
jgi:hypothetical protein